MTHYDDCTYCSTCRWHHDSCWCRSSRLLRDETEPVCYHPNEHVGDARTQTAEPCTPAPVKADVA